MLIIADNQAMAEILNGNQVYQGCDEQAINILMSTTRSLTNILKLGWKTKDTSYDLIQWRERRWNKVADELCNQAMDEKDDREWWTDKHPGRDINIMAFVDGGRRDTGESASAYAVFAIRQGFLRLIGKGACYARDGDSFVAECRAMMMATSTLERVLTSWSTRREPALPL